MLELETQIGLAVDDGEQPVLQLRNRCRDVVAEEHAASHHQHQASPAIASTGQRRPLTLPTSDDGNAATNTASVLP